MPLQVVSTNKDSLMTRVAKMAAAALLAATLAACATAPAQQSFDPPPAKRVDAKTHLESGRR
jgi:ABC-type uncharacterized transport system auxiliary subunit